MIIRLHLKTFGAKDILPNANLTNFPIRFRTEMTKDDFRSESSFSFGSHHDWLHQLQMKQNRNFLECFFFPRGSHLDYRQAGWEHCYVATPVDRSQGSICSIDKFLGAGKKQTPSRGWSLIHHEETRTCWFWSESNVCSSRWSSNNTKTNHLWRFLAAVLSLFSQLTRHPWQQNWE